MDLLPSPPPLSGADRRTVDEALALAEGLSDELRPLLLRDAGDVTATQKGDGSPVTSADMASDRLLRDGIETAFPDHVVITEEGDTKWPDSRWTWVIDPIDGTSNYTAGLPYWCVSIALCLDGRPVLGLIDAPALDRRFTARTGAGAAVSGRDGGPRTLAVREGVDFRSGRSAYLPVAVSAGTIRNAARGRVRLNPRILGAYALDMAHVAAGVLVGSWSRQPKLWDAAAGMVLVQEAGGTVVQEAPGLVPPDVGEDLTRRPAGILAGPDEAWLRALHDALTGAS